METSFVSIFIIWRLFCYLHLTCDIIGAGVSLILKVTGSIEELGGSELLKLTCTCKLHVKLQKYCMQR